VFSDSRLGVDPSERRGCEVSNPSTPIPQLVVQSTAADPLPPGSYFATFESVVPYSNDKVTNKLRWVWKVVSGPQTGREATALTDQKLTAGNHAGRLVSGMAGRSLQSGEDVSALLGSFIGKKYLVTVASGPKGGKPSVQNVTTPPEM
jgi:hypothetical protein